jgi:hypothetical protein
MPVFHLKEVLLNINETSICTIIQMSVNTVLCCQLLVIII